MKKALLALVLFAIIVAGGFMLLLSQSSPDNAPRGEVITDITPETP